MSIIPKLMTHKARAARAGWREAMQSWLRRHLVALRAGALDQALELDPRELRALGEEATRQAPSLAEAWADVDARIDALDQALEPRAALVQWAQAHHTSGRVIPPIAATERPIWEDAADRALNRHGADAARALHALMTSPALEAKRLERDALRTWLTGMIGALGEALIDLGEAVERALAVSEEELLWSAAARWRTLQRRAAITCAVSVFGLAALATLGQLGAWYVSRPPSLAEVLTDTPTPALLASAADQADTLRDDTLPPGHRAEVIALLNRSILALHKLDPERPDRLCDRLKGLHRLGLIPRGEETPTSRRALVLCTTWARATAAHDQLLRENDRRSAGYRALEQEAGIAAARHVSARKKLNDLLDGTVHLRARIVGDLEPNTYEIVEGYERGILKTSETTFSTKGWFTMRVIGCGRTEVNLIRGGTRSFPCVRELHAWEKRAISSAEANVASALSASREANAKRDAATRPELQPTEATEKAQRLAKERLEAWLKQLGASA